jgi:cation diffusion facilitator CzcD-associated flavoprotein CzcO
VTYSKMWTLRSPKHVTGPDLGVPSLAPRSWFEAVYGEDGWERLGKWPRETWQAYLDWYRDTLELPVRNEARLVAIHPDPEVGLRLEVDLLDERRRVDVLARKLVLATGLEGMGGWYVPPCVATLPGDLWSLASDTVESSVFAGRSIGMLGAGATAWDRAADLLEHGAASVTMFMRRAEILQANPFRYMEKAGYLRHYASMDDARKWRWMTAIFRFGQPPTQDGVNRCAAFPSFRLMSSTNWRGTTAVEGDARRQVEVLDDRGQRTRFDHLFVGCGFSVDAANRPELAPFAHLIARWRDRFPIPAEDRDEWLADYPYVDRSLAFVERIPGTAPFLKDIHCFNYGATMTNAHSGASLSGMKYGIVPLVDGITRDLWDADEPYHYERTRTWAAVDTDPTPILGHIVPPGRAER